MNGNQHSPFATPKLCLSAFLLLIGFWLGVAQAQSVPPEVLRYADLVLYNGQVLTMDRDRPPIHVVQALAIRDGRIMAVGESDRILQMAGEDTLRVDLGGKAVIPGVVDTHSHPNSYALTHYDREITPPYLKFLRENQVWYANLRWDSKATTLADLKVFAQNVPPGDWILVTTRSNPVVRQELTREDVDQAVPDNPLFIRVGYGIWGVINTQMLDVIRDTYGDKLLPGIIKDEQGVPTGRLFGTAGEAIDVDLLPQMPPEILAPVFKKELEEWVAVGVTTLSTRLKGREISAYSKLDREGQLPLRLAYSSELGRANPLMERDLKRMGNIEGHGTDRMWLIGITIPNPDGTGPQPPVDGEYSLSEGQSSCATIPKREILPNDLFPEGICFWDLPDDLGYDTPAIANRYGYRIVGVHNFGDKSSLINLDAYDLANEESSILDRRFALDHGMMVSPEVIERSAKLGIIWSLQPSLFYGGSAAGVSRVYGERYAHEWVLPTKSLLDAGVKLAYGADTHRDPDRHPMFNLEVLVTRRTKDGRVFGPREAIDRANGLLMMTRWGGEYVIREKDLGSLEVGKLADLVILDRNPLDRDIADEELSEIQVRATLIGGEVVYGSLN